MKINILTLFPKMITGFFEESIVKRAQNKKLIEIELINIRDFAIDDYGTVDDKPYGGGAGMVMRVEPVYKALATVIARSVATKQSKTKRMRLLRFARNDKYKIKIILTTPKGIKFSQEKAIEYSKLDDLIIIAGHYEGTDERIRDFVDEEVSLGDFVLSGGELVASCITEAVVRLVPGVLKKIEATQFESFFSVSMNLPAGRQVDLIDAVGETEIIKKLKKKGIKKVKLLEYPQYTRPEEFKGKKVPEILLSGDHKKIEKWQIKKAYEETLKKRPDLLDI